MNLHALFPTPVARFSLDRAFTDAELEFCIQQDTTPNMGNRTSADRYVLKHDALTDLNAFIERSIAQYLKEVFAPKHDCRLRVTQSWLNYTEPGQFHHKHAHPNSFVSGCLYIKADRASDKIHFFRDGYSQVVLHTEDFNLYNSPSWWLDVHAGDLLLFPSSLTHMVEPVQGTETRVSLSLNTFPVGYVGKEEMLTALHLGG